MALLGTAFLAIWHDVLPELDAEYVRWHSYEHMAERVGVPGFERGRRCTLHDGNGERYFTLYEGSRIEVFSGADYMARLAAPTPWTQKVMPALRNNARGVCRTGYSQGDSSGGAILTLRLELAADADLAAMAGRIRGLDGVVALHIGRCVRSVTEIQTVERSLRPEAREHTFDSVAIVEGTSVEILGHRRGSVEAALYAGQSAAAARSGVYALSQMMLGRAA